MNWTDGEIRYVKGSGANPYKLMYKNGIYSCSCPSWIRKSAKIDQRSCKHLRSFGVTQGTEHDCNISHAEREVKGQESPNATTFNPSDNVEMGKSKRVNEFGGFLPFTEQEKAIVTAREEARRGHKLRQDEKADLFGPPVLLAHKWDGETDPANFFLSEKKDGVRAYWNGREFISRQGNVYQAPAFFTQDLPKVPLDGELFKGRKMFDETISIVKSGDSGDRWKEIRFEVFDAPNHHGTFEQRIECCKRIMAGAPHGSVLEQTRCTSVSHLRQELARVEALGGEGVMLRRVGSKYEVGRSYTLLKVKSFVDCEVEVVGFVAGKGKFRGMIGSLQCRLPNGKPVDVGSGISDQLRKNPPQIGAVITIRYQELSKDGVPRFPVFVAMRNYE